MAKFWLCASLILVLSINLAGAQASDAKLRWAERDATDLVLSTADVAEYQEVLSPPPAPRAPPAASPTPKAASPPPIYSSPPPPPPPSPSPPPLPPAPPSFPPPSAPEHSNKRLVHFLVAIWVLIGLTAAGAAGAAGYFYYKRRAAALQGIEEYDPYEPLMTETPSQTARPSEGPRYAAPDPEAGRPQRAGAGSGMRTFGRPAAQDTTRSEMRGPAGRAAVPDDD